MTEHAAVTPHAIRHRAYERWLERGSPDGSPERDWLEAERELLAEAAHTAGNTQAPTLPSPMGSGVPRRRAPRSLVTRAGTGTTARLLAALVPEAVPQIGHGTLAAAGRGRR